MITLGGSLVSDVRASGGCSLVTLSGGLIVVAVSGGFVVDDVALSCSFIGLNVALSRGRGLVAWWGLVFWLSFIFWWGLVFWLWLVGSWCGLAWWLITWALVAWGLIWTWIFVSKVALSCGFDVV